MTNYQRAKTALRLKYCTTSILESALFWFFIGFMVANFSMMLLLTEAFSQIDKLTVCK